LEKYSVYQYLVIYYTYI